VPFELVRAPEARGSSNGCAGFISTNRFATSLW